jgi:hypothetical protein
VVDNKALQGLLSQSITQNIGSDLDGALQRIKGLAQSPALTIPSSGYSTQAQIRGVFSDIRNAAPFDELFLFYVAGDRVSCWIKLKAMPQTLSFLRLMLQIVVKFSMHLSRNH